MFSISATLSTVCLVLLIVECTALVQASQIERPILQLVTMVSKGSSGTQDWERGLEILPGARVAVQEVNRNTDILPGYQLELVEIITEGCSGNLALVQLIQHLTTNTEEEGEKERQTVGIIGPLCREAAELVAMVAGHPGISLVQIVATQYYIFSDRDEHLNPFQMLPLSQEYGNTVVKMMRELDLERLAIVCSLEQDMYGCENNIEILNTDIDVSFTFVSPDNIQSPLSSLRESGAKFILAVLPDSLAVEVVCAAYLEGMNWPEYGWIFPGPNFTNFTAMSTCGNETVSMAIEGLFLLDFAKLLSVDPSNKLVSGHNYSTYYSSYIQELRETANRTQRDLRSNFYASLFYDSVWAFALALNKSYPLHFNFEKPYLRSSTVAACITTALMNNSKFSGATGPVAFDENRNRVNMVIQINQIRNKRSVKVGQYNPSTDTITINTRLLGAFPDDDLEVVYDVIPLPLATLLIIIPVLGSIFLIALHALHVIYRNEPEVKATKLSRFMFLGCYLLLLGTLLITISSSIEIHGAFWRIATCQVFSWLTLIGIITFLSTLLVRLVRVYRVFNYFGHTGKKCSNGVLSAVILSLMLVMVLLLALWAAVDVYQYVDETFYRGGDGEAPHLKVDQVCDSEYFGVWISVTAAYISLLLLGVAILAVKTRKIRRRNFKDTKKLNILVAILVMTWTLFPTFLVIIDDPDLRAVLSPVAFLITAFSYQCLFFLPKVWPPLIRTLRGTHKAESLIK